MVKTSYIDVVLFGSHGQVIIKRRKVDPRAERGARILIKESDKDERKARLILYTVTSSNRALLWDFNSSYCQPLMISASKMI
jgi:hypothetical protein